MSSDEDWDEGQWALLDKKIEADKVKISETSSDMAPPISSSPFFYSSPHRSADSRPTNSFQRDNEVNSQQGIESTQKDNSIRGHVVSSQSDCELTPTRVVRRRTLSEALNGDQSSSPVRKSQNSKASSQSKSPPKKRDVEINNILSIHQLSDDEDCISHYIYPSNLEIRKYQLSMVDEALRMNILCALPTGLGKTFIASTVMLNWYRWTKTAKIIFMAPTKPLVSQQVEACLGVTGIPRSDVSIMIGGGSGGGKFEYGPRTRQERAEFWDSKRVFFATPHVVRDDMAAGVLDPKTVVCLVVDEAHRATGQYPYTEVVRIMKESNPTFRVLALSATPGSSVEAVQEVVTNLDIARIEIRTEDSPDIREYVHERKLVEVFAEPDYEQKRVTELLSELMQPMIDECNTVNALPPIAPQHLKPFFVQTRRTARFNSPGERNGQFWKINETLRRLHMLSMAMDLLNIYGVRTCYEKLREIEEDQKNSKSKNSFAENTKFLQLIDKCKSVIDDNDEYGKFAGCAKAKALVDKMSEFFQKNRNSRAIVFVQFREPAAEVVRALNQKCKGLVSAEIFIGQSGGGSKGKKKAIGKQDDVGQTISKGMNQKLQQQVVKDFKEGKLNTLVATSIGEEGLDIGEVDLVVLYNTASSSISTIQRMGRTGRKRAGEVFALYSTQQELAKFKESFKRHSFIQKVVEEDQIEDYAPAIPILPEGLTPSIRYERIEIPEENKEVLGSADVLQAIASTQQKTASRRRKNVENRSKTKKPRKEVPEGLSLTFQTVREFEKQNRNLLKEQNRNNPYLHWSESD